VTGPAHFRGPSAREALAEEVAGAGADPGAGPRPGAAHVETLDRRAVAAPARHRAQEEALRRVMAPAELVAADEVRVRALEVGRRQHVPSEDEPAEARRVLLEQREHAVGHRLLRLVPIRRREL